MRYVLYTIYCMSHLYKNTILLNKIEKKNWKFLSNNNNHFIYQKFIGIDIFNLQVIFQNSSLVSLKISLTTSFPDKKKNKLLYLINLLNEHCISGNYTINFQTQNIIYSLNLELKYHNLENESQLLMFFENIFHDVEIYSKNLSLGAHQIFYGNFENEYIKDCIFTKPVGNA